MNRIIEREQLNESVVRIKVEAPRIAAKAKAGQFVILRANGRGERIPLTIAGASDGAIELIFQVVGGTTMRLSGLRVGEEIPDLVGPLGNPTPVEGLKRVAVVGGGVGCAIALPVARALAGQGAEVISIIGFRNRSLVILEEEFRAVSDKLYVTTDDGSHGEHGNVCLPLERLLAAGEKFDAVFTVGPLVMMKFVAAATRPYGVHTIASMNPIMIDGTGMCGCCRVTVDGEMRFACVDGPDFDAHSIDFDEAILRAGTYKEFENEARERHCNLYRKRERDD